MSSLEFKLILGALLLSLIIGIVTMVGRVPRYIKLKRAEEMMEEKIRACEEENAKLRMQIKLFKERNKEFIEKLIREELGWIKEGEYIVKIK